MNNHCVINPEMKQQTAIIVNIHMLLVRHG